MLSTEGGTAEGRLGIAFIRRQFYAGENVKRARVQPHGWLQALDDRCSRPHDVTSYDGLAPRSVPAIVYSHSCDSHSML